MSLIPKIIVADDDQALSRTLSWILKENGYDVVSVAGGEHLLEHLTSEQVDLLLDVWITPTGKVLLLDEDEFASDTTLNAEQRKGAQQGLQDLLKMLAARQEAFSEVEQQNNTECVDTTL